MDISSRNAAMNATPNPVFAVPNRSACSKSFSFSYSFSFSFVWDVLRKENENDSGQRII
jgi:hypothetical protein